MDELDNVKEAPANTAGMLARQISSPNLTDRLENEKQILEARLAEVNEAIAALKANPEIERVLNLVGRVKSRY